MGERHLPILSGWCHGLRWLEQEVQRKEDSRRRMSSNMGSCQTTGFSSVTEDAAS
jgi:hypothetical protein